jgi:phosphoribosyl 1,2-cyclic phosphodiesterase
MKITFLGTGAADWHIERHREVEGFRRNSSCLVDDTLLIDPGSCVPDALETFGKSAEKIKYVINTHKHRDHYNENTLESLTEARFYQVAAGEEIKLGKYTVSAHSANHATAESAVHFIISDGERRLFYGLDGAWLTYPEVEAIKKSGVDLAVLDATVGDKPGDYRIFEHNNLNMVLEMKKSLKDSVKRYVISHMAYTLHTDHKTLEEEMKKHDITTAYDGLVIEF